MNSISKPCSSCATMSIIRHSCTICRKHGFCSMCLNYAVVRPKSGSSDALESVAACRACFRLSVSLDLSVKWEVVAPQMRLDESSDNVADTEVVTVIALHGGGGSRALYRPLAATLSANGIRTILVDLPAHGGRMDEPLSIDSVAAAVLEAMEAHKVGPRQPFVLLGGSLGGFAAMELLGRYPNSFMGAVICCASQNTGFNASFKAKAALSAAEFLLHHVLFASTTVGAMISMVTSHKHLDPMLMKATGVDSGFYFHSGASHVQVLRCTNSREAMRKYHGPVLFLDGSEDHHDMLTDLVEIATTNELCNLDSAGLVDDAGRLVALSRSVLYKGADHFFSHDKRFRCEFESDVVMFVRQVAARCMLK